MVNKNASAFEAVTSCDGEQVDDVLDGPIGFVSL
jgi:hypothetical protein